MTQFVAGYTRLLWLLFRVGSNIQGYVIELLPSNERFNSLPSGIISQCLNDIAGHPHRIHQANTRPAP